MRSFPVVRLIAAAAGLLLLLAACSSAEETSAGEGTPAPGPATSEDQGAPADGGDGAGGTLVVDKSFDLKTADPGRQFEVTGSIVGAALYDTLLTFEDADVSEPVPSLAESYEVNDDATEFTFTLRDDVTFSDGSTLDSDDVAFSLNRVRNLKGNGSFLMDGVTAEAVDERTVVLRAEQPTPQLLRILPNPTLGILNADLVRENGGSAEEDAAETDTAEEFLNSQSAGTGPYMLESWSTATETVLAGNPDYWGESPVYERVVLRNVETTTQALNVQSGQSQIALDLASDQLSSLRDDPNVQIVEVASPNIWFLFANANPEISETTSNPDVVEAIRYGLDYDGILDLAGEGAEQAAGVIPSVLLGALDPTDAVSRDLDRARQALERSGVSDPSVSIEYPSDFTANGLNFGPIAERVQANLQEVGFTVELQPNPIATALENYRAGTEEMGLWLWAPDYPDPADYLVFGPGGLVGLRAGWPEGSREPLEELMQEAATTVDDDTRVPLFTDFQQRLNDGGPFFPLFQPTAAVVARQEVGPVQFHPAWTIDLEAVGR